MIDSLKKIIIKKAFTLAEVLITLGIIGIVATITIPLLSNNVDNSRLSTQINSVYSILSNATLSLQNTDGVDFTTNTTVLNSYKNVLKVSDTYSSWASIFDEYYFYYKALNKEHGRVVYSGLPAFVLNNGMPVAFWRKTSTSAWIYVDVDGKGHGADMIGKDFVAFILFQDENGLHILPFGSTADNYTCVKNSSAWETSYGCTAYYISGKTLP